MTRSNKNHTMDLEALGGLNMKYSMSVTKGMGNQKHNLREQYKHPQNVDFERTKDNIVLRNTDMREAYHQIFDKAVADYNARQKRSDRKIKDYYSKIANSKKEKLFHELVIQIGNFYEHPGNEQTNQIYKEFLKTFEERNPQMKVVGAYIHNDESTPHMHIDYIPIAKYSRGQSLRVANNRAIEQMGYENWEAWKDSQMKSLEEISRDLGIEREEMGDFSRHLSVRAYKMAQNLASKQLSREVDIEMPDIALKPVQAHIGLNFKTEEVYRKSDVDKEIARLADKLEDVTKEYVHTRQISELQQFDIDEMREEVKYLNEKPYRKENRQLCDRIEALEKDNRKLQTNVKNLSARNSELLRECSELNETLDEVYEKEKEMKETFDITFGFLDTFGLTDALEIYAKAIKENRKPNLLEICDNIKSSIQKVYIRIKERIARLSR